MKFRKKPVVISAMLYDGKNYNDILNWMDETSTESTCVHAAYVTVEDKFAIPTLEGTVTADIGDWVIRGVKGEFYPCKPDIFAATYEPVEVGADHE